MFNESSFDLFKVWDIRRQSSISTLETHQPAVSLDIHQSAPLFGVWTATQNISLHSLYEGRLLNQIKYHEGLLGNRLGTSFLLTIVYNDYYFRACQLSSISSKYASGGCW